MIESQRELCIRLLCSLRSSHNLTYWERFPYHLDYHLVGSAVIALSFRYPDKAHCAMVTY